MQVSGCDIRSHRWQNAHPPARNWQKDAHQAQQNAVTPCEVRKPRRFGYWKRLADGSRPSATFEKRFRCASALPDEQHLPPAARHLQYAPWPDAQPDVMDEDAFCVVCVAVLTASLVIFRLTTPARPPCRKPGRSGCGFATGASFVSKAADRFPNCPGGEGDTLECHHRLTQHRAAGMPHIDADTCHEAVDSLRNLEKADCAEKPDQHISGHGLAAGAADRCFNIAFFQSKRRYRQGERKQKNGAQQRNDFMIFLRDNDLL